MKKTLLLCAAALCSLMASAGDGLVAVGANVILLPSSRWDGDIEWKAWTWVSTGGAYGEWNTDNANYNQLTGIPNEDGQGRQWYEPDFDKDDVEVDINVNTGEDIVWEEHTAPFSSDATYNGRPSYRWVIDSNGDNVTADIYVRRTFTTDQLLSGPVYLACGHDDAPCEYYINGELVFERTGYETNEAGNIINGWDNNAYILLTDEQKSLIKLNGEENVFAFHVHQNWGGAFADGGLYTKLEGGLDMGYTTPWEGKVLFNSFGGYNWDGASPSNNPKHPWSALYEAQEGDEYTFLLEGAGRDEYGEVMDGQEILEFRTPIRIEPDHSYNFKARVLADKPIEALVVTLNDNDEEALELAYDVFSVEAPAEGEEDYEGTLIDFDFEALPDDGEGNGWVKNFRVVFDFGGGEDSTTVTLKDISLRDVSESVALEDEEIWVGTHYFNIFNMHKTVLKYMYWDETLNDGEGDYREARTDEEREESEIEAEYQEVNAPEISGRTETKAWTQVDFDDTMWDDQMMPVGNAGYMAEVQSIWPGIDNTNYWIRRNFELDKINERLSYELNVCHDDVYETYVNGHLLQKNVGWTNGKSPVQVHIPAKFLNVGKNVIATYIQQNWGGKFYDCGINVTEVNYDECLKMFQDAVAYAQTDTLLTNKMHEDVQALIDNAMRFYEENKNDAAELRSFARDSIRSQVNAIFAYSPDVKALKDTYEIVRKMELSEYWAQFLADVPAALDTCATSGELAPYLTNLRTARKAASVERHTEKYVGTSADELQVTTLESIEDIESINADGNTIKEHIDGFTNYYIYNVGEKQFLGGGEAWGTHLALEYASHPMRLIQAQERLTDEDTGDFLEWGEPIEGAYYIETFRPNGRYGDMDFMGWNGFIDCAKGDNLWELIPVEGKENVFLIAQYGSTFATDTIWNVTEEGDTIDYTTTGGGKKYLGLRSGDNSYDPSYFIVDTDMHSPELESNQWMFVTREEMIGLLATASEDNPIDVTFLINNPGYDQRLPIDEWQISNDGGNVSIWGRNGNWPNFTFESWNAGNFSMYQDIWPIEGEDVLPAGTYMLEVQGYYRDGSENADAEKVLSGIFPEQRAYIYASSYAFEGEDAPLDESYDHMPLSPISVASNQVPGIGWTDANHLIRVPGTYSGQIAACAQAATEYFPVGCYKNKLAFTIPEDDPGHLCIGIYKDYDIDEKGANRAAGDWCVMDNWRLTYYGGAPIDPDAIRGIESDEISKTTAEGKGIYNMLGQRLSKAQRGVNIIGGKKIIKK